MKKNLIQIVIVVVITVFIIPSFADAQAGKVNFTGNWILNVSKSSYSARPTTKIVVKQDGNILTEVSTMDFNGKSTASTSIFSLNGEAKDWSDENYKYRTWVSWSSDGKSMTIHTSEEYIGTKPREGTSGGGGSTVTWSLQDAKTLVISSENGDAPADNYIYEKK
jgi:hypothetical protein